MPLLAGQVAEFVIKDVPDSLQDDLGWALHPSGLIEVGDEIRGLVEDFRDVMECLGQGRGGNQAWSGVRCAADAWNAVNLTDTPRIDVKCVRHVGTYPNWRGLYGGVREAWATVVERTPKTCWVRHATEAEIANFVACQDGRQDHVTSYDGGQTNAEKDTARDQSRAG